MLDRIIRRGFGAQLATLLIVACLVGAAGAGAVAALESAKSALISRSPGIDWHRCSGAEEQTQLQCGTVAVPVNWDVPDGDSIDINVARLVSDDPTAPSTLFSPGGPGMDGVQFLIRQGAVFGELTRSVSVVSWTPRGLDKSSPLMSSPACQAEVEQRLPQDEAAFVKIATTNAQRFEACRQASPTLFDNLDSESQARDMNAIRAALGDEQVSLFMNSYGGVLGETYLALFPRTVTRAYFDSVVPHSLPLATLNDAAYTAEAVAFRRYESWCQANKECAWSGRDVSEAWQALVDAADRSPIPASGSTTTYSGADLRIALSYWLGASGNEADLFAALARTEAGDAGSLNPVAPGYKPQVPVLAAAIQCADGFGVSKFDDLTAMLTAAQNVSPATWGSRESYGALCAGWQQPIANPIASLAKPLPAMLIAAPLIEAPALTEAYAEENRASLITYPDYGHGLYVNEGNPCVVALANAFLVHGAALAKGISCSAASG